ncbi:hypothetical protein ACPV3A_20615 [Paenibacillus sp. Dod16]|uniref:hypothetical protein n=1 Tax=unclassified Paenibacillus TaxID=185978 RepID=UPI00188B9255|nr:hypothetical protein [Paenibacillus sp. JZ16]
MKKAILRWVMVLSALYCMGHILFDFKETHLMRIFTGAVEISFFGSILLYINLKTKEGKSNHSTAPKK